MHKLDRDGTITAASIVRQVSAAALICLVVLLFSGVAVAQSDQALVSGSVTDAQGASISNAKVSIVNTETGVGMSTITNESGAYLLPNLKIGKYSLIAERDGFKRYSRTDIVLSTAERLELNVRLDLGQVTETVNVTAAAPIVENRTSDISQTIESRDVEDLPLGNRRTMNVVNLSPAAVFVGYDSGQKPNFSLAGGRTQSQMFWIDGASGQNMRLGVGQFDLDPPAATVQEIRVLSNNYAAEYGASAGGVIIETTKSGTNEFHGSAYEFLRNDAFDAPGYFAPVSNGSKVAPKLRYNVFGVTAGGPIRRNKTFFFFGYEGQRQRTGSSTTFTVPTLLQTQGDFSQTVNAKGQTIPIYDPGTTAVVNGATVRTQFPGDVIPAGRLDAVGVKMLGYYPAPNQAASGATGANNYNANGVTGLTGNFFIGKVDHAFSERDRVMARYLYNSGNNDNTSAFTNPAADPTGYILAHQQYIYSNWVHVFGPALVNDARFNYGNRVAHALTLGVGSGATQKLGLTGVSDNAFPNIAPAGYKALGSTNQERRQYPIQNYEYVDNISWILGKHALKFGFEARESANYEVNLSTASGSFTFATTPTGLPGNAATGNGVASLLLGFPTAFSESQTQVINRHSWYLAGFVQDDYTVTSNLTLNLGLRWETDTPITDASNRMNGFDSTAINPVSGTPGVVKFMGLNGYSKQPYPTDWNNFGPRFGFAWKPFHSDATVVRGGYGVFFAHPFDAGQPASAALGFSTSVTLNSPDNGITAPFYLASGVPVAPAAPTLNDSFGAVAAGKNPNTAVTYFDPAHRTGYSQQFNLDVQRELPGSLVVEISGLANISHKLPSANLSINQILPSVLGLGSSSQANRPYPQFSNVTILSPSLGDAQYFAGFVRVKKRFSSGLNLNASYTYSKFLDNTSEGGSTIGQDNGPYSNYYNRTADWGPSANDIRNRFVFASVYDLPFGKGKKWLSTGVLGHVAGGWTIATVTTLQSGAPFTVVTTTNTTNAFSAGSQRADVSGNPNLPSDKRSVAQWFDTAAFSQPATFKFGNQGRDILRAPGLINVDASILRDFALAERKTLQLRGEFLNAINHTNLSVPNSTYGSAGFGSITASGPARQIQIGAKFEF
jgi:hypothetical protein